jgi:PhnB protein
MTELATYLTFDGKTREAMEFYKDCLGGELSMFPYSAAPGEFPNASGDRIMHATLRNGPLVLMAADSLPGAPLQQGNNFSLSLHPKSIEETQRLFTAIGRGGKVGMPLQDTFWGAHFGMLTDKFGIQWMFNWEKPKG